MTYSVKEIFYTLQGEGANMGQAAVFCRFSGCNLWSGREQDRASAQCRFCDTDFIGTNGSGGGKFKEAASLAQTIKSLWPHQENSPLGKPLVVCTGGEPLLQLDQPLIDALHEAGFTIAVETNGTLKAAADIDWLCVSPKADNPLKQKKGQELKLVFPQEDAAPEQFEHLDFTHFFLQPMDGPNLAENTQKAVDYIKAHPRWRLSLQSHKLINIP